MGEEVTFILSDAEPKVVLFEKAVEPVIAAIEKRFPHIAFWYIDEDTPEYARSYHEKVKAAETKPVEIEVDENDLYAIMYTSGTTGRPKGVMHKHRNMVEQSLIVVGSTKLGANDTGLVTAPMFHCAELHCAFLPRIHVGGDRKSVV